ncbi:unnamed protein product [Microthlaspi erraticum]|uniref:Uncharacterized protein n=1 Tax=Microthlaspi erraticum TaxID=1685480 RepID=A0A6D2KF70_9BRAS|nr:unnamed protein product [Microthlaspi erraticum]
MPFLNGLVLGWVVQRDGKGCDRGIGGAPPSVDWRAWFSRRRKTKGPFGFEKWSIIFRVSTFKPAKIVIGRFPEWPELKRSRKKYLVDRTVGTVGHRTDWRA